MTTEQAKKILIENNETFTDKEVALMVELCNRVFDQFEINQYGRTLKDLGVDNDE